MICCFQKGQKQTHIQKVFLSGKQIEAISPPFSFLLTFVFELRLLHAFHFLCLQNVCVRKHAISFQSCFGCTSYAIDQKQETGEGRR